MKLKIDNQISSRLVGPMMLNFFLEIWTIWLVPMKECYLKLADLEGSEGQGNNILVGERETSKSQQIIIFRKLSCIK